MPKSKAMQVLRRFFSFSDSDRQIFVCMGAFLFLGYIWFASAGTMSRFPTKTHLVEMQADTREKVVLPGYLPVEEKGTLRLNLANWIVTMGLMRAICMRYEILLIMGM